jgi:hypothetical protein
LSAVLRDNIRPISELAGDVPTELERLIARCLMKDPADRPASMAQVHETLEALKQQSDSAKLFETQMVTKRPETPAPPSPPLPAPAPVSTVSTPPPPVAATDKPSSSKAPMLVGALVLLLAIGGGAWWMMRPKPAAEPVAQIPAAAPAPVSTPTPPPPAESAPAPAVKAPEAPKTADKVPAPATPTPTAVVEPPKVAATGTPVTVADGLPVPIVLAEDIPNSAADDLPVKFTVADDIRVNNVVVIAKGALVSGSIVDGAKKKFLGMGGKMTFRVDKVNAVDSRTLTMRATPGKAKDGPAKRQVDVGTKGKPKDMAAVAGTRYIGYIDGAHTVHGVN